jgi:hypothetical protein
MVQLSDFFLWKIFAILGKNLGPSNMAQEIFEKNFE